jgi:superfamily I DNA/RNA helicase
MLRIMDLQQEQLARGLGDGHRVVHGVAGSGKTMILGYRCLHLAKQMQQPILVLCYNKALAHWLASMVAHKGLAEQFTIRNFHGWCHDQLRQYHVEKPRPGGDDFFEQLVETVIDAVDKQRIPRAQYGAVLIDEGHDFQPQWLRLITQMIDPDTNSLLLLYDDAQSIYRRHHQTFSFKSVGIQAQGRTTILRLNYRNTAEVLNVAYNFACDVMSPEESGDDGIPLLLPESAERHGALPTLVRRNNLHEEAIYLTTYFQNMHQQGIRWSDMAVLYRMRFIGEAVAKQFKTAGIPCHWQQTQGNLSTATDSVQFVTMHSSKGLELPLVSIPGLGYLPHAQANLDDEVRLMYVGVTRAVDQLVMTCHRDSEFVRRLMQTEVRLVA